MCSPHKCGRIDTTPRIEPVLALAGSIYKRMAQFGVVTTVIVGTMEVRLFKNVTLVTKKEHETKS